MIFFLSEGGKKLFFLFFLTSFFEFLNSRDLIQVFKRLSKSAIEFPILVVGFIGLFPILPHCSKRDAGAQDLFSNLQSRLLNIYCMLFILSLLQSSAQEAPPLRPRQGDESPLAPPLWSLSSEK